MKHAGNQRCTGSGSISHEAGTPPYSALAAIYDQVMDHVDYENWAAYISSVFSHLEHPVSSILEIACGTGSLSREIAFQGYSLTCSDISPAMLKIARDKLSRNHLPVQFAAASMTALPFNTRFDAVLCLYDSINYLTDGEDVMRALNEVASVLNSGGYFIFDVCTVKNSELFFFDHSMQESFGEFSYERICRYDRAERIQENHFTIVSRGETYSESHYQKIYRLDEIESFIGRSPLSISACFDDMTFMQGSEESERVHYVLEKK